MINLTKADQTATIDLSKGTSDIVVRAQWVDRMRELGFFDKDNDGDPDLVDVPLASLLSKEYATHRRLALDLIGEKLQQIARLGRGWIGCRGSGWSGSGRTPKL